MKTYDVVVIGAGIHGAGVAQAAAVRGLSVLVLERRQAAGMETSRASSKLIHGGLRYLETGQFRLVYECLHEQRRLLRNAPHLVRRSDFYVPVYRHSQRSAWWIHLGLLCYRVLAGWRGHAVARVPKEQWKRLGLTQENLTAVFRYGDAQTDDQLLTRAVLESARSLGAEAKFSAWPDKLEYADSYHLRLNDGTEVRCRGLVNAAGPWANEVAAQAGMPQQEMDWVQGTHIVLRQPSPAGCFYVEAPQDRRAVFILPWRGLTMVGTTEMVLAGPAAAPTQAEIDYLLGVYNHYFPSSTKTLQDVMETFAGVRVLPKDSRAANRRSRETVFITAGNGTYVAVYGGKLTSYRATAEKVVNLLQPALGVPPKEDASTADLPLP